MSLITNQTPPHTMIQRKKKRADNIFGNGQAEETGAAICGQEGDTPQGLNATVFPQSPSAVGRD